MFSVKKDFLLIASLIGFLPGFAFATPDSSCFCNGLWSESSPAKENIISSTQGTECLYKTDYNIADYQMMLRDKDVSMLIYADVAVPKQFDYQVFIIDVPSDSYNYGCGINRLNIEEDGSITTFTSIQAFKASPEHVKACKMMLQSKGCQ